MRREGRLGRLGGGCSRGLSHHALSPFSASLRVRSQDERQTRMLPPPLLALALSPSLSLLSCHTATATADAAPDAERPRHTHSLTSRTSNTSSSRTVALQHLLSQSTPLTRESLDSALSARRSLRLTHSQSVALSPAFVSLSSLSSLSLLSSLHSPHLPLSCVCVPKRE